MVVVEVIGLEVVMVVSEVKGGFVRVGNGGAGLDSGGGFKDGGVVKGGRNRWMVVVLDVVIVLVV